MTIRLVEVFNQTQEIRRIRGNRDLAAGVCCGLSLRWLKLRPRFNSVSERLTRLGMDMEKAITIEQEHALWALNQQPAAGDTAAMHWQKVDRAIRDTLGVYMFRVLDAWPADTHHAAMNPAEISLGFTSLLPRYFIASMDMGEKHMCAGYCTPGGERVEFFDPNRGEYLSDEGIAGIFRQYGILVRHLRIYDVALPQ